MDQDCGKHFNSFYENTDKICAKETYKTFTFRLPLEDLYPVYLFPCMIHESYFICVLPCYFHTKYYYIAASLELLLWSQCAHFFFAGYRSCQICTGLKKTEF